MIRKHRTSAMVLMTALLWGCQTNQSETPWVVKPIAQIQAPLPTYADLALRYNQNLKHLSRLWARADVVVKYVNDKGKRVSDRADSSTLLLEPPDRTALALGHAGGDVLWAGCDAQRYWAFDLHADDRPVYVGQRDQWGAPTTLALPSPIAPQQLPAMFGLTPLPINAQADNASVQWREGRWLVDLPAQRIRLLLDPKTALPVRIDMVDALGQSVLAVRLYDFIRAPIRDLAEMDQPRIASRIEAWLLDRDVHVRLKLRDATDGIGRRRIDRAFKTAFDFDALMRAHRPKTIIDLDSPN